MQLFPNAKLESLVAPSSDHFPILLDKNPVAQNLRVKRSFKFENAWRTEDGINEVVRDSWSGSTATSRKKVNKILSLETDEGIRVTDDTGMRSIARNYFENLFEEEFKEAMFSMQLDKCQGPDGFNPGFYQHFWSVCSEDIFKECCQWMNEGQFPPTLNSTNIALISKGTEQKSMKDWRSIALCNVLYKLLSKVLANRLKKILSKCIADSQSAFVPGRSILDNALVAIELIHHMKTKTKGKDKSVALKLDISKAYDRIDWSYLRDVMHKMGFSEKWIQWIMMCVETVDYSVIMNQEVIGPIIPGRGLRQGDPLSPYLFILCAEGLSALIRSAESNGVLEVLGTGKYLGLPSMVGRSKKATFSFIKDRVWQKISSWSSKCLSKAGREVMIKSVLQSIPSYIMSIFRLPNQLLDEIEKMMNTFWWGHGGSNNKGLNWLSWEKLSVHKNDGGMGFKDLEAFNVAMLGKQGWKLQTNTDSLVSKIFKARYYPNGNYLDAKLGHNPSFVWRSIFSAKVVVRQGARWKIGNGFNIPIVSEPWIGSGLSIPRVGDDMIALQSYSVGHLIDQEEVINNDHLCRPGYWSGIWKLKGPPKVKSLIWRICRDCFPRSIDIWQTTNLWHLISPAFNQFDKAPDIIFNFLHNLSAAQIENVVTITWSIWKARNLKLWQQVSNSTTAILERAKHLLDGWRKANRKRVPIMSDNQALLSSASNSSNNTNIRWRKPESGRYKCNVDASFPTMINKVGFGMCIRDSDENHVRSKTMWFNPTCSVDVGEALALDHAIRWIQEFQLLNVDFEVD
ncbi:uncharacterized protein [Medicago truncatula]|uniref:uncharacterized protein n=1 Tax=Medicago truncatula TaxID=3880 RepID=UPI001967DF0D|nr:uncharacterized protein LOC112422817 [Medicago truncatula]